MTIAGFEVGSAVRSADGFAVSGDAAVVRAVGDCLVLCMIDVLGHGPQAHAVALRAEQLLERSTAGEPGTLLAVLDRELAGSLGAAVGIAMLHGDSGEGSFAGVGNIVARIFGEGDRRLVSTDGIVGQGRAAPRTVDLRVSRGEVLLLHTDGISSRLSAAEFTGAHSDDAGRWARELVRRFGRAHDDAACIVARRPA